MKTIFIIGNGPSMKKEYLYELIKMNVDTLGMNVAYRFFNKLDWLPTYYTCLDGKVCDSHKGEFIKMMEEDNEIKEFIFYKENFPNYKNDRLLLKDSPPNFKNQRYVFVTTGSCAVRYAIEKGYKRIVLLGVDANYKEKVAERELMPNTRATFKLKEDPKDNPNYWFDGYQQKGDVYNIPNSPWHKNSWRELSQQIKEYDVEIIQTNKDFVFLNTKYVDFYDVIKNI